MISISCLEYPALNLNIEEESNRNAIFELNWTIVKDWSEQSRYIVGVNRAKAADFRSAVVSRTNGILPWLQRWW